MIDNIYMLYAIIKEKRYGNRKRNMHWCTWKVIIIIMRITPFMVQIMGVI